MKNVSKPMRCLFTGLILTLIASVPVGICYEVNKVTDKILYAIFGNRFNEPVEVMYLLMNDMTLYKITSNYESHIYATLYDIGKKLDRDGYEISDILIIIHGHKSSRYFSTADVATWRRFKRAGFTGKFCLYLERNKTIYEITEDE